MPHHAQGTTGWTKLKGYQAVWDPKIDLGKFYFTTFRMDIHNTPLRPVINSLMAVILIVNF